MSTLINKDTLAQKKLILQELKRGKNVNPIDALEKFGCFRLGARIYDIKKDGNKVDKKMITTKSGKRVASYFLKKSA